MKLQTREHRTLDDDNDDQATYCTEDSTNRYFDATKAIVGLV